MSEQLRSIYARWERLEEEKAATSADLKELFIEAKGNGYDAKALRAAFRLRSMSSDEGVKQSEHEALVDLYLAGLNGTEDAPRAHPRIPREEPNLVGARTAVATSTPAPEPKTVPAPLSPEARRERAKVRTSESMDDNKDLSARMLADGLISEEAHAENVRLSDAVARKFGAGVVDDDLTIPSFMRRTA